jgi:hypothetical protein
MKKIRFQNFNDLKQVITILERHGVEFTWDFMNRSQELYLGHVNIDHVKLALSECHVPYKIMEYYG